MRWIATRLPSQQLHTEFVTISERYSFYLSPHKEFEAITMHYSEEVGPHW
jgi:hypothetical protein